MLRAGFEQPSTPQKALLLRLSQGHFASPRTAHGLELDYFAAKVSKKQRCGQTRPNTRESNIQKRRAGRRQWPATQQITMFCQCYDVAETRGDPALPPWRMDVLQARVDRALARELRRVVVVARGPRPAIMVYPEHQRRGPPVWRANLDTIEVTGEPALVVRVQPRGDAAMLLRFGDLDAKRAWWRAVAALTTTPLNETADELDHVAAATSEEDSDSHEEDASTLKKTRMAYERAVQAFVRPPRARYDVAQLGPRAFPFRGHAYRRQDATCANKRGEVVRYSVWRRVNDNNIERRTLVHVHANAGCRLEALAVLGPCLALGFSVIALDCAGSGLSGGEHTTLGWRERDDVKAVIDAEDTGSVTLWGRSMGAATALLYAATRNPDVTALILDSPFQSLRQLAFDVVGTALGGELIGATRVASVAALRLVRGSVRRRAGFDIYDVDVETHARECGAPTLVVCALDDALVPPSHSHAVHAALPRAELCVCPGTHNSVRPDAASRRVERFLREHVLGEAPSGAVEGLLDDASPTGPRGPVPPWTAEARATRGRATRARFALESFSDDDAPAAVARRVLTPESPE